MLVLVAPPTLQSYIGAVDWGCLYLRAVGKKWAGKVPADRLIAAVSLDTLNGTGRTLADEASSRGGDAALGSGAFRKVEAYRYHGATVAVKPLQAWSDEESIGAFAAIAVNTVPSSARRSIDLYRPPQPPHRNLGVSCL